MGNKQGSNGSDNYEYSDTVYRVTESNGFSYNTNCLNDVKDAEDSGGSAEVVDDD
jgi:hypothetical protein